MKKEEFSKLSQDDKLNYIFESSEKTRKMYMWTLIIGVLMFVLPLIGLMFVIPAYLNTFDLTGLI